jgi:hypothetical protein
MSALVGSEIQGGQSGSGCGCSSGGKMAGGSGYSLGAGSSPMLLGPQSGYGAADPYAAGITTGSGFRSTLAYPPLTKFIGGKKSAKKSSKKSSSKKSSKKSSSKSSRKQGGKKSSSKSSSKKSAKKSSSKKSESRRRVRGGQQQRKSKSKQQKRGGQRGGELSFSDYVSSGAASSPSVGQIASSPIYGVDVNPISHSALANPVIPEIKNNCK